MKTLKLEISISKQFEEINKDTAEFISIEELERVLEERILKYEKHL
ncbi:MAG: hypothetical protein JJE55_01805 [Flavobacteriaceae bacterium]|nr:hypothetical protein [Flavobacteriaceae bacterium]